jgi:hypothetical protein
MAYKDTAVAHCCPHLSGSLNDLPLWLLIWADDVLKKKNNFLGHAETNNALNYYFFWEFPGAQVLWLALGRSEARTIDGEDASAL